MRYVSEAENEELKEMMEKMRRYESLSYELLELCNKIWDEYEKCYKKIREYESLLERSHEILESCKKIL